MDFIWLWNCGDFRSSVSVCYRYAHVLCLAALLLMFMSSISRIQKLGITKLQADDYIMINATFWYTLLVVSINMMIAGGGSNFMTPDEIASLTPQTVKERVEGSKWVFVSEQAMILTIWSLKLCMLFIYGRLTYVTLFEDF